LPKRENTLAFFAKASMTKKNVSVISAEDLISQRERE
jgi:hypothetical protein